MKAINLDLRDKVAKNNLLQDEVIKLDQKQLNQWYSKMFARLDNVGPKIFKSDTKPVHLLMAHMTMKKFSSQVQNMFYLVTNENYPTFTQMFKLNVTKSFQRCVSAILGLV